jgi:hypothetical protein
VEYDVVAQLDCEAQAVGRQFPFRDQLGDQIELGVLIQRLVEHQLEDRLRVRREPLIGIPGRHVARPADGQRIGGLRQGETAVGECRGADDAKAKHLQQCPAFDLDRHRGLPLTRNPFAPEIS